MKTNNEKELQKEVMEMHKKYVEEQKQKDSMSEDITLTITLKRSDDRLLYDHVKWHEDKTKYLKYLFALDMNLLGTEQEFVGFDKPDTEKAKLSKLSKDELLRKQNYFANLISDIVKRMIKLIPSEYKTIHEDCGYVFIDSDDLLFKLSYLEEQLKIVNNLLYESVKKQWDVGKK